MTAELRALQLLTGRNVRKIPEDQDGKERLSKTIVARGKARYDELQTQLHAVRRGRRNVSFDQSNNPKDHAEVIRATWLAEPNSAALLIDQVEFDPLRRLLRTGEVEVDIVALHDGALQDSLSVRVGFTRSRVNFVVPILSGTLLPDGQMFDYREGVRSNTPLWTLDMALDAHELASFAARALKQNRLTPSIKVPR